MTTRIGKFCNFHQKQKLTVMLDTQLILHRRDNAVNSV